MFVLKLSSTGDTLISSTFLGGDDRDGLNGTKVGKYPTGPLAYNYGDEYRGEVLTDK